MIASPATTKFGRAMPTVATDISEKSSSDPRRVAEITPAVNPRVSAKAIASTPRAADLGSPAAITSLTEKSAS